MRPNVAINLAELYSAINGEHLSPKDARNGLKSQLSNLRNKLRIAAPDIPIPIYTAWGHGAYWNAGNSDSAEID